MKPEDLESPEQKKAFLEKIRKELREQSRVLELMRSGLKERPLDQDFFDRKAMEYEQNKRLLELGEMVLSKVQ